MNLGKSNWYIVPLAIAIVALVALNELGYGVIAFLPLMLLAYWLMEKVFQQS